MHDHIAKVKYIAFVGGASIGLILARGFIAGVNHFFPPNPIKN